MLPIALGNELKAHADTIPRVFSLFISPLLLPNVLFNRLLDANEAVDSVISHPQEKWLSMILADTSQSKLTDLVQIMSHCPNHTITIRIISIIIKYHMGTNGKRNRHFIVPIIKRLTNIFYTSWCYLCFHICVKSRHQRNLTGLW